MIVNLCDPPERVEPYERAIVLRWLVNEFDVEEHGEPATLRYWVALHCDHHGRAEYVGRPDRCFRAVVRVDNETTYRSGGVGWTKTAIHLGGPRATPTLLVLQEPVARYSAEGLEVFAASALSLLRRSVETDPRINELIEAADQLEAAAAA